MEKNELLRLAGFSDEYIQKIEDYNDSAKFEPKDTFYPQFSLNIVSKDTNNLNIEIKQNDSNVYILSQERN